MIVRYAGPDGLGVGLRDPEDGVLRKLAVASIADLLGGPAAQLAAVLESLSSPVENARLLPPIDGLTEVWASGVTYRRSKQARQEESHVADVYARVYDAARPELFMKSPAWRVCGPGEPIGVRCDSEINVPEPELALVYNASGELVGLTICDDVSSRSIEGENPLYLPQAKIYSGACALGPGIVPIGQIGDPADLGITVTVTRAGEIVWHDSTSTALMHRSFDDLAEYLFRQATFPQGVVLSTGTGLVPELTFTLALGDEVVVEIEGIGTLANSVASASSFGWLTPAADRAPA